MLRPSYRANLAGESGSPLFGLIFEQGRVGLLDSADLSGGARAARSFIG